MNLACIFGGAGQNIVSNCIIYLLWWTIINQEYFLEQLYFLIKCIHVMINFITIFLHSLLNMWCYFRQDIKVNVTNEVTYITLRYCHFNRCQGLINKSMLTSHGKARSGYWVSLYKTQDCDYATIKDQTDSLIHF